ncbi:MAG TPA: DUF3300 domain-containing protein, partial [Pseudoxanthomonas sp.]|nr:DUF3300 domain-containing protein [Pseudoxanthomonas sp.]
MLFPAQRLLVPLIAAVLTCTAGSFSITCAQAAPVLSQSQQYAPMVASVALYPDPLLAQVFTAAQFPDQVAAASRWLRGNAKLSGDAATRAAARQRWNASVKSLVAFPVVLHSMASQPAWTRDLGQAYAKHPADVMAAVQSLRRQAQKAGSLKTGGQQKVVVVKDTIAIQSVNPRVVYVPSYDPVVVYGTWAYATAPVVVVPRPSLGYAVATGLAFGLGVAVANSSWGYIDWDRGTSVVNNYYSDNSVYTDRSDNSSHYEDNSDNSSHSTDNSDHSSHSDDHSDRSSSTDDHSDRSSSTDDHSDRSSRNDDHSDRSSREQDDDDDDDDNVSSGSSRADDDDDDNDGGGDDGGGDDGGSDDFASDDDAGDNDGGGADLASGDDGSDGG